jgi:hypothetical protein
MINMKEFGWTDRIDCRPVLSRKAAVISGRNMMEDCKKVTLPKFHIFLKTANNFFSKCYNRNEQLNFFVMQCFCSGRCFYNNGPDSCLVIS